ncbi:diacylglycerol acyltransferase domain-containing protein [Ditylenchus destructor]|nr:diacylglycerol acyltransferase domain-containing protein [Ditylenchus destructor]
MYYYVQVNPKILIAARRPHGCAPAVSLASSGKELETMPRSIYPPEGHRCGVESSNKSLRYLLQNPGYGRLIGIVIGGAEEALDAKPGVHDLNIMNRRGFCRHAMQMGAYLVPSYSFGENEIFDQKYNARGSAIRKVQTYIKKQLGFCPPLFTGRGFFSENFGLLPYRKPITTIVGPPIPVEKCDNPTLDQIDALHVRYCESLKELFEDHKTKYGVPENVHLNLL